jgi:prepilin-type N-terminal cleavage/methylation domain-containing protein
MNRRKRGIASTLFDGRRTRSNRQGGFTLVELVAVVAIIGIILSLVLIASMDAARRAEERATQTLIAKLEGGLNDRLEALLQSRPDPNWAHAYLAAIWSSTAVGSNPLGMIPDQTRVKQTLRAQVIAWYDYIKSELPDVFFIDPTFDPTNPGSYAGPYPFRFAGNPYPGIPIDPNALGNYILPLGHMIQGPVPAGFGDALIDNSTGTPIPMSLTNPSLGVTGTGIYGASYYVAAGLYKNLGYLPAGYDGVDNGGIAGLVDDWGEGIQNDPVVPGTFNPNTKQPYKLSEWIKARLANHKHSTARSEMLYAILVEGRGPLGSAFSADEFSEKEVRDTDGDGLPEFIDAWGQPLQFFRWPALYHSDIQRGQVIVSNSASQWQLQPPYYLPPPPPPAPTGDPATFRQREQDPLDVNQQLMAPAWFGGFNDSFPITLNAPLPAATGASNSAQAFAYFFHRLTEPYPGGGGPKFWDRGSVFGIRRAFYSKFLILSGGPDRLPGVFLYPDADLQALAAGNNGLVTATSALIANENNALPFSVPLPNRQPRPGMDVVDFSASATIPAGNLTINYNESDDPTWPSSSDLIQAAQDDISNHNLRATGGIGGS